MQWRRHDSGEAAAVVVPAVAVKTAPSQFQDEADPPLDSAVERGNDAAIGDGLSAIKIDAVRGEVLANDDEGAMDLRLAIVAAGCEMDGIGVRIPRLAAALNDPR